MKTFYLAVFVIAALGAGAYWMIGAPEEASDTAEGESGSTALVRIVLPDALSANALIGKQAFEARCASCHGENTVGQDGVAPPLVHKIYEPSRHGDEAIQRAAAPGVRAHHWPFGNIPPVEGLTRGDVTMIVAYVRELQRANGIN